MMKNKRIRKLLTVALPIIGGMLSQNLFNIVDTSMIGHLGANALAGVGLASMLVFVFQAVALGVSTGVQAWTSIAIGSKDNEGVQSSLWTGISYSLVFSSLIAFAGYLFAPNLLSFIDIAPEAQEIALEYFQIRIVFSLFPVLNYSFRGFWTGLGDCKIYFQTLVIMHVSNALLNGLLIYGFLGFPQMGTAGAAYASVISVFIGLVVYIYQTRNYLTLKSFKTLKGSEFKKFVFTSINSGFITFITTSVIVSTYSLIGQLGTTQLAAANLLHNLFLVFLLPAMGLGMASATLMGQDLGAGQIISAKRWGKDAALLCLKVSLILVIPTFFFSKSILAFFTNDLAVIEMASLPLRFMLVSIPLELVGFVLMQNLNGAGRSSSTLKIAFSFQWLFFIPLVYIGIHYFKMDLIQIWLLQSLYRLLQSALLNYKWQSLDLNKFMKGKLA